MALTAFLLALAPNWTFFWLARKSLKLSTIKNKVYASDFLYRWKKNLTPKEIFKCKFKVSKRFKDHLLLVLSNAKDKYIGNFSLSLKSWNPGIPSAIFCHSGFFIQAMTDIIENQNPIVTFNLVKRVPFHPLSEF